MMEVEVDQDEENETAGSTEQEEQGERKKNEDRMKGTVDCSFEEIVCDA